MDRKTIYQLWDSCLCCGNPIIISRYRDSIAVACHWNGDFIRFIRRKKCPWYKQCKSTKFALPHPKCLLNTQSNQEKHIYLLSEVQKQIHDIVKTYGYCYICAGTVITKDEIEKIGERLGMQVIEQRFNEVISPNGKIIYIYGCLRIGQHDLFWKVYRKIALLMVVMLGLILIIL